MSFDVPLPLFPAILMLITWLCLYTAISARGRSAMESMAIASINWGICVWFLAEILSWTGNLTHPGAVVGWSIAAAAALFITNRRRRHLRRQAGNDADGDSSLPVADRALIAVLALLVGAIGIVALATPIVAWDAQQYHIPRIFYWVQNGSIEHYPTSNPRQLFMSPWSAFFQLHIYLLSGTDQLAHLPQWLCMVGCLVLGSGIAKELGGRRIASLIAAALIATIPMGILQASTALVDYVTAFWLMALVFLGLRSLRQPRIGWPERLSLGGALGLAVLAKGTAVPIAAPFVAVWMGSRLRLGLPKEFQTLAVTLLVALVLSAPHFARNLETFGHLTGPQDHRLMVLNHSHHPRFVVSNLVRQNLVHLGTEDPEQARLQISLSNLIHRVIGVEDGDPRNSTDGRTLHIEPLRRNENWAGNPAHWLLYVTCGLGLLLFRWRSSAPQLLLYGACLVVAIILFAAVFKYQEWISRLQLPLFVLAAPWSAVVLTLPSPARLGRAVAWIFLALSVPWIFFAEQRPLLGSDSVLQQPREVFLYKNDPSYRKVAKTIARKVGSQGLTMLGLLTDGSALEYYLWYEVGRYETVPRFFHLAPPAGWTRPLELKPLLDRPPRFVAWLKAPVEAPALVELQGHSYRQRRYWRRGPHGLYRRVPGGD